MKKRISDFINDFVEEYQKNSEIETKWGKPLVGFADAMHPLIQRLPDLIRPSHGLPQDVIRDARIVICYYVPFTKELAKTNQTGTDYSSPEWALAYEETNAMFGKMNMALIEMIQGMGYDAGISPKSATFDQEELVSDWSYRHFAYAAGLGTFGINNMLITKRGCCGRYNTVVTNLPVEPDSPQREENCLYKKNGSCGICMKHCPVSAITPEGYQREKCYAILKRNAEVFTEFGSSYTTEDGENANSMGSEVCGKCITGSPCAVWNLK